MSVSRVCGRCAHLCRAACPRSPTTLPPACRRTIGLLPPLPPSFRHLGHAPAVGLWTSDILPSFTCRAVAPFAAAFSPPSPCPLPSVCGRPPSCHLPLAGLLPPLPPSFHHLRHAPAVGLLYPGHLPVAALPLPGRFFRPLCRPVLPFTPACFFRRGPRPDASPSPMWFI